VFSNGWQDRNISARAAITLVLLAIICLPAQAQSPGKRSVRSAKRDDSSLLEQFAPRSPAEASPTASDERAASAEKRIEPSPAAQQAERAVRQRGYLTIDHSYPADGREAAVHGPSLVPPGSEALPAFQLMPVEISTEVQADGSGALVLPCPRDVVDQIHVACRVSTVRSQDGREQPVPHKATVVYTLPTANGGYVNPFLFVDLNDPQAKATIQVRTLHWLVIPKYSSNPTLQSRLQQMSKPIQAAIDLAAKIEYDVEVQIDEAGEQPTRGDCSVKAYVAADHGSTEASSRIEVVEGYRYRVPSADRLTGGCHFQNLVLSPAGLFMFDATSRVDYFLGPPERFITTSVGGEFSLPALNSPPGTKHRGSNMGFYTGFESHGHAHLSTPTFGERAEALRDLAKQPDRAVAKYAEALWRDRLRVYSARK